LSSAASARTKTFERARRAHVETRERLVEDDDTGIVHDGVGDQDLLAHALGVRRQRLVPVVVNAEQLEEPLDLLIEHAIAQSTETADEPHVFGTCQVRIQVRLFQDVAEMCLEADDVGEDVHPVDQRVSRARLEKPGENLDCRALA
jgi:hypothetical protein